MRGKQAALAGVSIVLAGCGGGESQSLATVTSTLKITKTVEVTLPAPPFAPKVLLETDGTYRVGTDMVPGTYRSGGRNPAGDTDCYWARLSSLNSTHIIDNGLSASGPQVVTIQPGDAAFLTRSCLPWQKD